MAPTIRHDSASGVLGLIAALADPQGSPIASKVDRTLSAMLVTVVLVVLALAAVAALTAVLIGAARSQRAQNSPAHPLPAGAEAALHSVTEVQAHPRNVLVLKDPTSQMRLTRADRDTAARTAARQSA
jgi:flagellar basal body-associated protein FliL